jgi:hypothetical protein
MKTKSLVIIVLGFGLGVVGARAAHAQSLADVARAERAKQAAQPKAVKVYTNDNIPHVTSMTAASESAPGGAPAEAGKPSEANATPPASTAASEAGKAPAPEEKAEDKAKTKEYWQSKFAEAQAAVSKADEELSLSQDELNLAQMNEARELDPDKQKELSQDVTAKQAAADSKREADEKAKQALDELKKEFEESGAPKEWLPAEETK